MIRCALKIGLAAVAITGCATPAWKQTPHDTLFQRVPQPRLHGTLAPGRTSDWWPTVVHTAVRPLAETLSPGAHLERWTEGREALDINSFGQVLDSPWFTNRIGRGVLSKRDMRIGPNTISGPAPGPLTVIGGKLEGATPGLVVRDTEKNVFIVKFDPPAFPKLSSGGEVISTHILHAAGYFVPENYVLTFNLSRLDLDPSATTAGEYGEKVSLDRQRLDDLLSHVNPFPDGSVRALFSRYVPGTPIGPFSYRGVRTEDPNDRIPHEHRRSLRGLRMFSAWLNNVDTRAANSLDVFIASEKDPTIGHIRHYLLDFGDSFGSAGTRPKYIGAGYESKVDWTIIWGVLFSAGMYYPYWLPVQRSPYRSVGVYEAKVFDPSSWEPNIPNPAFDRAATLDEYWAASIIARFTPDLLAEAVRTAEYSEPGAFEWVLRVLTQRQYKILEYAFAEVLPLEDPVVDGYQLRMTDLAVQTALLTPDQVEYHWTARWNRSSGSNVELGSGRVGSPEADLEDAIGQAQARPGFEEDPFVTVRWQRSLPRADGPAVDLHLRVIDGRLLPVGMER